MIMTVSDPVAFVEKLQQENKGLEKLPPSVTAALTWVHPFVLGVHTLGKSAKLCWRRN